MRHYYAIAERGNGKTWWITFPHSGDCIVSAADDAGEIIAQAQDGLASVLMVPSGELPRSIEEGAPLPTDLSEFKSPVMVVVIPFEAEAEAREAA